MKESITEFLKEYADMFAWTHTDMPEIDSNVMVHKLNVDPNFKSIR